MTHEELEPIMATLGFVALPPTGAWREYVFPAGGCCRNLTPSEPLPRPRLPFPRIDSLHIYTYRAFFDAVAFFLGKRDIADHFHVRVSSFCPLTLAYIGAFGSGKSRSQVLLSQSHRFRALVLLGRFLDMKTWAVDLALSVGIFPYVLKLLQTIATELRQILVFIWTKILALDKWLCVCLGKLWEDFPEAQTIGLQADAPTIYAPLLSEPQPEVRASTVFALGTLLDVGSDTNRDGLGSDGDCDDDEKNKTELNIVKSLLKVVSDGSPLVRAEVAVARKQIQFFCLWKCRCVRGIGGKHQFGP